MIVKANGQEMGIRVKTFRRGSHGFNSIQGAEISPLLSINLSMARARGILESIDLGADGDRMKKLHTPTSRSLQVEAFYG